MYKVSLGQYLRQNFMNRPFHNASLIFYGTVSNTLFLLQLPRLGTVQIIMIMVGRLFGAFGFGLVYLYTAELFPTKIRNTAIGTCSSIARIGT